MFRQFLESINNIDLNSSFAYENLFAIFSQIQHQPYYVYNFKKELNISFYRSRKNQGLNYYFDFKDISYPPSNKVLGYSRANKPLQNLFYLSDNLRTSLFELKLFWSDNLSDGEIFWVTAGKWDLIEDLSVVIIPDFTSYSMKRFINVAIKKLDKPQLDFLKFINSKFMEQASPDNNIYKITSAFCNAILDDKERKKESIDGVLFTSVHGSHGINLALSQKTVDSKKFELNSVVKLVLRKTTDINNKPVIEELDPPIFAHDLDFKNKKIIWGNAN
jgi:hypothetical protein